MLRIKIEEKQRKLVRQDDVNELIDQLFGIALTHLSGMAARCSRDMVVRRNIDAVVTQIRRELATACLAKADECGEPPLSLVSRTDHCEPTRATCRAGVRQWRSPD